MVLDDPCERDIQPPKGLQPHRLRTDALRGTEPSFFSCTVWCVRVSVSRRKGIIADNNLLELKMSKLVVIATGVRKSLLFLC